MTTSIDDSIRRGIVNYTSRDYQSLLQDFIDAVPKLTELWKPEAEADPGMVIGKYIASVAEVLGINVDLLANEIFAPSVSQRKNAEKIFSLIGYELGWYVAARTEITFTNVSSVPVTIDFGFNGSNFATVNAYTDITNASYHHKRKKESSNASIHIRTFVLYLGFVCFLCFHKSINIFWTFLHSSSNPFFNPSINTISHIGNGIGF